MEVTTVEYPSAARRNAQCQMVIHSAHLWRLPAQKIRAINQTATIAVSVAAENELNVLFPVHSALEHS